MEVAWSDIKSFVSSRSLPLQYIEFSSRYVLTAFDGTFALTASIVKSDPVGEDQSDFEANYKAAANQPLVQRDTDGAQIVRIKAAKKGWSFWSVPIEIVTSTLSGSLFCQDNGGNALSWISSKIYDADNVEITTAGLLNVNLNTCVKTVVDFEPPFNYEIIGGSLRINSNPSQDVRLWVVAAPDIPANLGGSKEFASGINIKFLSADNSWDIDGRVTKAVTYDPVYHSGKIRLILKHPLGLQVNLMFVVQLFRQ